MYLSRSLPLDLGYIFFPFFLSRSFSLLLLHILFKASALSSLLEWYFVLFPAKYNQAIFKPSISHIRCRCQIREHHTKDWSAPPSPNGCCFYTPGPSPRRQDGQRPRPAPAGPETPSRRRGQLHPPNMMQPSKWLLSFHIAPRERQHGGGPSSRDIPIYSCCYYYRSIFIILLFFQTKTGQDTVATSRQQSLKLH